MQNRRTQLLAVALGSAGSLLTLSGCAQLEPAQGEVADRLDFYANLRLRGEGTLDQQNGQDRYRGRLRARVGVKYEIAEGLEAEARVSTSSGDANNPHWDFGSQGGDGDGFNGAAIDLDRLFVTWTGPNGFGVQVGKMPHAFSSPPITGEFVWDGDVSPAGGAAVWRSERADVRLAGYVAGENNSSGGSGADPVMLGAQGNLYWGAGKNSKVQLSTSYMDWSNVSQGTLGTNQGNSVASGRFREDFAIWESFLAVTHTGGLAGRQQAFLQYMNNLDASENGYALGVKLGPSSRSGDTSYFLSFYDLEENSVFSPVAQDDTPIAGTGIGAGMSGFLGGIQHYLADHVTLKLWATSSIVVGPDPYRLRLDLDVKVL